MVEISPHTEKRRYPRYVFSRGDNVKVLLSLSNGTRLQKKAIMMDVSRGGIGLALSKTEKNFIREGDRLKLECIFARNEDTMIETDFILRIVWVLEHSFLDNIGFGCEFQNPSMASISRFVDFMNSVFPERIE